MAQVAVANQQNILSYNSSVAPGHNGLPLSLNTAFARQQQLELEEAASERARVRDIQAKYFSIKIRDITIYPTIPWPESHSNAVPQLLHSVKAALEDILQCANPSVDVQDPATWVRGWDKPLKKVLNKAEKPDKRTTGDLISDFAGIFTQVNLRMDEGMDGGAAFDHLLRLLASHFKYEGRGDALTALNAFVVPNGTTFGEFLRKYRTAINNITHLPVCLA